MKGLWCLVLLFSVLHVLALEKKATQPKYDGTEVIFFVATNGNDDNNGTIEAPFLTLQRANEAVSTVPRFNLEEIFVVVRGGRYYLDSPLELNGNTSSCDIYGMDNCEVVYVAFAGEEVVLIGGTLLPASKWTPWNGNKFIFQIDLIELGITDFGELSPRGMSDCSACINTNSLTPSGLELFQYPHQDVKLARYPNVGYSNVGTALDNGLAFTYTDGEPKLWTNEPDIWVHGYWGATWTDKNLHVEAVDVQLQQLNISADTPPNFGMKDGDRYFAYNILAELDAPGEYYLNRTSGILYFWSPTSDPMVDTYVSMLPYVIQATGVSSMAFSNFTIVGSRGAGVQVFNSTFVYLFFLNIMDVGTVGVNFTGGEYVTVAQSNISYTGNGGVFLQGGNRTDLTSSYFTVYKCDISYFNRWVFTYAPGIFINGVGSFIEDNTIHNGPHMGLFLSGNNHVIYNNTLHDLVYETADAGAFYMGRDWSYRGNTLARNSFININTVLGTGEDRAIALYLDDSGSGFNIFSNLFQNCSTGIMVGGGRDNLIIENQFIGTNFSVVYKEDLVDPSPVYNLGIHFDNRDMNWAASFCAPGGLGEQFLQRINYQSSYYAVYPNFQNIMQDDPCTPKYNLFASNTYCYLTQFLDVAPAQIAQWGSLYVNNTMQPCL